MKVLWLTNVPLPAISRDMGEQGQAVGGWLSGYGDALLAQPQVELTVCFPAVRENQGQLGNLRYYAYPLSLRENQSVLAELFCGILKQEKPQVVHIFGTEFGHSEAMVMACGRCQLLDQTLISIQGLVSVYARHYSAFLPERIVHKKSFRDLLKGTNVARDAQSFARRGASEIRALKGARHVIGRTDWDEACVKEINPQITYHFCNETLRGAFYENGWSRETCKPHAIFVSQCSYPVKGFHLMLEAMAQIVKKYPDAHLYTTGKSPLEGSFKQRLRYSAYTKYLASLLRQYGLETHVTFLGTLNEEQMCQQYLRSHVFVSPSSIENSPNSVGEAMILGVPTVSSDVGGVKNMLVHSQEGFLYPADEPYMIAYYVEKLFEDDALAAKLSANARTHAAKTHHREENARVLMALYCQLADKK